MRHVTKFALGSNEPWGLDSLLRCFLLLLPCNTAALLAMQASQSSISDGTRCPSHDQTFITTRLLDASS